jgi:hypothetical protein
VQRKSTKFPKNKAEPIEKPFKLSGKTRMEIKQSFAKLWLAEDPYMKYVYKVENCDDGTPIFLHRPTYKHGLDFAVSVEGFRSILRKNKSPRPSHPDIIHDLKLKLRDYPKLEEDLFAAICAIYDCAEPGEVLTKFPRLRRISRGLPIDRTLRIIKWLFIEQDVTYWLGTGRNMFMSAIEHDVFKMQDSELFE